MAECPDSGVLLLLSSLTLEDAYLIVGGFLFLSALAWGSSLIARLLLNR